MRALGFTQWVPQTVSKSERNARRMLAEEVPGLAVALETTIGRLMQPVDEDQAVEFQQGGPAVSVTSVRLSVVGRSVVGEVEWDGDKPVIAVPEYPAPCRSTGAGRRRTLPAAGGQAADHGQAVARRRERVLRRCPRLLGWHGRHRPRPGDRAPQAPEGQRRRPRPSAGRSSTSCARRSARPAPWRAATSPWSTSCATLLASPPPSVRSADHPPGPRRPRRADHRRARQEAARHADPRRRRGVPAENGRRRVRGKDDPRHEVAARGCHPPGRA